MQGWGFVVGINTMALAIHLAKRALWLQRSVPRAYSPPVSGQEQVLVLYLKGCNLDD